MRTTGPNRIIRRGAAWALALAAFMPASAWAQHALGDGRTLDASLQHGSGGVNAPQAAPDYRARNDVITGNVAGLGYFRGSTGYRAAGELNARQSSDALFRFQAVSLPQVAPGGVPAAGGTATVLRPMSPGTGVAIDAPISVGGLLMPRMEPARGGLGGGLTRDRVVAGDGRALEVEASPLLGIRVMPVVGGEGRPAAISGSAGGVEPRHPLAANDRMDIRPLQAGSAWGTHSVFRSSPDAPGPQLGVLLGRMLQPSVPGDRTQELDRQLARIEASLFSPLGTATPAPGRDAYLDMLSRIRRQRDIAAGKLAADAAAPPEDAFGAAPAGALESSAPPSLALTPPTAQQLRAAEAARLAAQRQARQLAPPGSGAAAGPTKDGFDETRDRKVKGSLTQFMDAIAAPMPALPSFAAVVDARAAALIHRAEQDMIDRRYFDAEARYAMAIELTPGNPLPRLGQVHAQIGAGLVQSAAANLMALLAAHPEIAGVRCEPCLLPAAERLDKARRQLDETLVYSSRADLAILLAYMGRQSGQESLVRYGLDLAVARAADDPLVALLGRAWLVTPSASQPQR